MSTGSVSTSETGPPEREGLVGPLVTGREVRRPDTLPPAERVGPFRVGAVAKTSPPRVDDEVDDLPWLNVPGTDSAISTGIPITGSRPSEELGPAFGAADLPDPWDSYLSIGGHFQREPRPAPVKRGVEAPSRTAGSPPQLIEEAPASQVASASEGSAALLKLAVDPGTVEEVAARLERLARLIRERGPVAALAEHPGDPLTAMVAGYILGFSAATPAGARSPLVDPAI